MKFKINDKIIHCKHGKGIILGNYHKRPDGNYYWHVQYENGTFGYNRETSMWLSDNQEKTNVLKFNKNY